MGTTQHGPRATLPLNDFQQLMLQWNECQPFHVVDTIELMRPVDIDKLQAAAEKELTVAGVFHPIPNLAEQTVAYADRPVVIKVAAITHGDNETPQACLQRYCSAELSRSFQPGADPMFRLWVLRSAPGDYVGMTWQHWPCDGYAAADLQRRILARTLNLPAPEATLSDCAPADIAAAFRLYQSGRQRLARAHKTVREIVRVSAAYVAPRPADPKTPLETHFVDLPEDVLRRIQESGRRNQATVNDVIAAALMRALSTTIPPRNFWRRRVAISNIVDLRQVAPDYLARKWGLFLGFCVFDCRVPVRNQDELVRGVREQSRRTKTTKGFFASLVAMNLSRRLWPWLPKRARWSMSRCIGSFSGVLSNLRMPAAWFPPPWNQEIKTWWRTLPLGSIVPLSAAVTTFDTRLTLTLTTESAGYFAERIDTFKEMIVETLTAR